MFPAVNCWTYHYSEETMQYDQARMYCQSYYTDLVAIQNQKEIEYLETNIPFNPKYYWIGIRKINNIWTWVGTNKTLTDEAKNWGTGEPNNKKHKEDCVEIYIKRSKDSGKWNDDACSKKKRALCYTASCNQSSCSDHGECIETINNYTCDCSPGFYGPQCEYVVQCLHLSAQSQGYMNCSHPWGNFSFQSSCHYGCFDGFDLNGTDNSQCLPSGMWRSAEPYCTAVTCEALGSPQQGSFTCNHLWAENSFGSTCEFTCSEGWKLKGSNVTTCGSTGQWTEDIPECEAVTCEVLRSPQQGSFTCNHLWAENSFGSTCEFTCSEGWKLKGSNVTTCGSRGLWTEEIPECEAVTCEALGSPQQGSFTCNHLWAENSFGSTCEFTCSEGWKIKGSNVTTCGSTGQWTEDIPECEAITCEVLGTPQNGSCNCNHPWTENSFGSTCEFSCSEGWKLKGSNKTTCDSTGQWTEGIPECDAVTCEALGSPQQGSFTCNHLWAENSFGSTCEFTCSEGWKLKGSNVTTCGSTGQWTEDIPECEVVTCNAVSSPIHGSVSCNHSVAKNSFGSTCEITCLEGWKLIGSKHIWCGPTGEWTKKIPKCEAQEGLMNHQEDHTKAVFTIGLATAFSALCLAMVFWIVIRRKKDKKKTRNNPY
ncbi:E-selectin-like [Rhinoderma darwinii]|uniref:E-selectin-like n=1 Tax=Rhinoderma darwinii TaxID=43563 RepID=UPI003F679484